MRCVLADLGGAERTLRHSADYLDLFSTLVVGFMWLWQAAVAKDALARPGARDGSRRDLYEGKLCAAQYFIRTELPRVELLAKLCRDEEDSYARVKPEWL